MEVHPGRARPGLIEGSSPRPATTRLARIRGARAPASLKGMVVTLDMVMVERHPGRARPGLIEGL